MFQPLPGHLNQSRAAKTAGLGLHLDALIQPPPLSPFVSIFFSRFSFCDRCCCLRTLFFLSCSVGPFSKQVGADPATPVTGKEADVMLAAYYAAEVAAKTIKAGNTNTQVNL